MNYGLVGSALLIISALALSGCGGGGGSGSAGGGGASVNVPSVTFTGITVNSPPVVTFVVNDSSNRPVSGLTLYDASSSTACGSSNMSFAIAKFDGTNWQSLISRQRYASDSSGKLSVIEGTTDPKPATGYANPDTALNNPSTRIVGILEETNGAYTYHFATDVTASLRMVDAVDKRNVSLGKVANDGHLAVKDGSTLHRVVLQLCYVDPVTHETVKVNPYIDFTIGADGKGVIHKDSQGNPASARKVVDRESCNDCHVNFAQHGGNRVDPNYCVVCHNPGSRDFETGNPIDFKLMVHKFHMGKRLTQDYAVRSAVARKDLGGGVIQGVLYPQDQRNCVKCHDGSATAAHKTAQGDNWKTKSSKNACWSCHDDYKDAGSAWQVAHAPFATLPFFSPSVSDPDSTPDAVCQSCHNDGGTGNFVPTNAKAHEITEWVKGENYQYNLWDVTLNPDRTVTVEYSVSNPKTGIDYNLLDPQYQYTTVNTAGTTTTRNFTFGRLAILFGWNTGDYANAGAAGRPWSTSCTTVVATGAPTCDVATGLPKAGTAGLVTRGQPVAINAVFDSSVQRVGASNRFRLTSTPLPAAVTGTVAVALQGRVSELKDANTSWSIAVKNVVRYLAVDASTTLERRQVVSAEKCNACHGKDINRHGHGGSRTEPEVCVICHNGNNPLTGTSADFKRMIHMMHASEGENFPVWPKSLITTNMGSSMYAGLNQCDACHVNETYKQNRSLLGTSIDSTATNKTDSLDNLVISPKASVCSSCHTSAGATAHMQQEGGASFGSATQGDVISGRVFEQCDGCHQPGTMKPAHIGATP